MAEFNLIFFQELLRDFRLADFFDIAIITFFLYSAIIWFKQTASRSIVIGATVITFVFFLARTFDLVLTSVLFQAILAVLIVALVVVFQEDIRRLFERIATWGTFQARRQAMGAHPRIDNLIEGITVLASKKVGVLLVLKGRDPVDRHTEGGIALGGRLSKPLLYSIFEPSSPGHDGAVMVEGDQVVRFGIHLPLSKNLEEVGQRGTRHTAALGLSELCDALVLVVSEEDGGISVAEGGRLKKMNSAAELKTLLEGFYEKRFPKGEAGNWKNFFRQNVRTKIAYLFMACGLWFLFAYHVETIQRVFVVPIEFRSMPKDWRLGWSEPTEANVTFSGSERAFDLLDPAQVALSIDLSNIREGRQEVPINEAHIRSASNLSVFQINPSIVMLEAHRVVRVELPVKVQTVGRLDSVLELAEIKAVPDTLLVNVIQNRMEELKEINTEPVDLSSITETTTLTVPLNLPEIARLREPQPSGVRVTVTLKVPEETS